MDALKDLVGYGMNINMSMYGGFEQVGSIGTSLPRNDSQTTTSPGDIVLYSGNQIVIFYGSNSWAYTRLGKITGLDEKELEDTFGNGDVTISLSVGAQTASELLGDETIKSIAEAHGVSSAQVILRWDLQRGIVVIPGSGNPDHIKENLDLFGFELTEDEMEKISLLDRGEKHDWY